VSRAAMRCPRVARHARGETLANPRDSRGTRRSRSGDEGARPRYDASFALTDVVTCRRGRSFRLALTGPLRIRQVPAAPERLVELHVGDQTVAANLRERGLRRVELLQGLEHLEVVGQPLPRSSPSRP